MTPEAFVSPDQTAERLSPPICGVTRMLEEGAHQFDIVDHEADLSRYRVLVLPDVIPVTEDLARKIDQFVENGGALIASYRSGLCPEGTGFTLQSLGVEWVGEAPFSPDFVLPKDEIGRGLAPTEHVMYLRGAEVRPQPGAEVLAEVIIPYFNRTYKHFCSHRHTPSSGEPAYPGIACAKGGQSTLPIPSLRSTIKTRPAGAASSFSTRSKCSCPTHWSVIKGRALWKCTWPRSPKRGVGSCTPSTTSRSGGAGAST